MLDLLAAYVLDVLAAEFTEEQLDDAPSPRTNLYNLANAILDRAAVEREIAMIVEHEGRHGELARVLARNVRCTEEGRLDLEWECQTCGWKCDVRVPGFAGDGYRHFPDGTNGCGPLIARRPRRG